MLVALAPAQMALGTLVFVVLALVETTDLIRTRLRSGRTLEQAKAEGLPDKWKEWGSGFINTGQWIEIVYRSLQRNAGKKAALHLEPAPRDAASRMSSTTCGSVAA